MDLHRRRDLLLERIRDTSSMGNPLGLPLDTVESVLVSRYQRPRLQNWLERLVRRPRSLVDTLQLQLRTSREEVAQLESVCRDLPLLELLPWLDRAGTRIPWRQLASTLLALVDGQQCPLQMGEPNMRPPILDANVDLNEHQKEALARAQASPSETAWGHFCQALEACSHAELRALG